MTTQDRKNIYQRINEVMAEVSYIQKTDKKVNNQFTFVTHDSVIAKLRSPMVKHGIVMVPSVVELNQDGNRTSVKMEISFVNSDEPSDKIIIFSHGYGIDTQDKGVGKAVSYAVKYALLKLFALETGDDVEKDSIEYDSNPYKEEQTQEKMHALLSYFTPETNHMVMEYIEAWRENLKASSGKKWVEAFEKGLSRSIMAPDQFKKAVIDWHSKKAA